MLGVSASAATLTIDYEYSTEDNGFIVYGTSNDTKSGDEVTVEAYITETLSSTKSLLDTKTALTYKDSDGVMKYKTGVIPIDYTIPSGSISFTAYSAHAESSVSTTTPYQHYGISDAYGILKSLQQSLTNKNYGDFVTTATDTNNAAILGIDLSGLPASNQTAFAAVTGYLSSMTISVPAQLTAEQDYKDTNDALLKFRTDCEELMMVSDFAACADSAAFVSWYGKYSNKLKLSDNNANKAKYFTSNYNSAKYFEILKSENMIISDVANLKTRILDVAGLTAVAQGNAAAVSDVISVFSDRIIGMKSVDGTVHSVVCDALDGNTYSTFDKLVSAYNNAVPSGGGQQGGSPSPGGGGGGGGSIGMGSPVTAPVVKKVFGDMADDHWARDAVEYLYDMGIINGRTDEEFAPEENITRAEFIKILVCVKNLKLVYGKTEFFDVAEDAWYAPYINSAYQNNITSGYDDGTFKPNNNITREDMATMIFRTAGYADSGIEPSFADADEISDYAKPAVATLNQKGIINGVGENKFAPKAFATRAQAAQIIYNYLTK